MMTLTAMTIICQRTGRPDSSLLSVLVDAVGDGLVLGSIMEWNRGRERENEKEREGERERERGREMSKYSASYSYCPSLLGVGCDKHYVGWLWSVNSPQSRVHQK